MKSFKEFIAESYFPKWYNDESGKKSPEYLAVQYYQNGDTLSAIQDYLRNGRLLSSYDSSPKDYLEFIKGQIKLIDDVFSKSSKFSKPTVLWRGVGSLNHYFNNAIDKGYTSTALTRNNTTRIWSIDGEVIKIIVDKGIAFIDMNQYLDKKDLDGDEQEEILLPRNLTFQLIEKKDDYTEYKAIKK